MSDVEYVVNFGSDKSIQFVRLSMAEVQHHGARLGEEIVRCRDCEHFERNAMGGVCHRLKFYPIYAEPDGYCAWSKRKED